MLIKLFLKISARKFCQFAEKHYLCTRNSEGLHEEIEKVAAIAQLVEHDLAKVGVASSSLVCRSS